MAISALRRSLMTRTRSIYHAELVDTGVHYQTLTEHTRRIGRGGVLEITYHSFDSIAEVNDLEVDEETTFLPLSLR